MWHIMLNSYTCGLGAANSQLAYPYPPLVFKVLVKFASVEADLSVATVCDHSLYSYCLHKDRFLDYDAYTYCSGFVVKISLNASPQLSTIVLYGSKSTVLGY